MSSMRGMVDGVARTLQYLVFLRTTCLLTAVSAVVLVYECRGGIYVAVPMAVRYLCSEACEVRVLRGVPAWS